MHEYGYHVGFLRKDFGIESNRYSDAVFSGFHRYGMNDTLTLGMRSEATCGIFNFGPQVSYNINNKGVASASLSGSVGATHKEGAD